MSIRDPHQRLPFSDEAAEIGGQPGSSVPGPAARPAGPLRLEQAGWEDLWVVELNYAGWRLDRFLTEKIRRATRSKVARILRSDPVTVNGRPARTGQRVWPGDQVAIRRVERQAPRAASVAEPSILDRGPGWIALHKPPGMLVHRSAHEVSGTVDGWLERAEAGMRVEPVHRLDRDTSGVLLCGVGVESIRALREMFGSGSMEKTYAAWVLDDARRWCPDDRATFTWPLGLDATSPVGVRMGLGSGACATHVRCVSRRGDRAGLAVRIDGGRQHQIRVHLFMAGTPVVGDKLYAMGDAYYLALYDRPDDPDLLGRLETPWHCLHAAKLRATLPTGPLWVSAPLPPHFPLLDAERALFEGALEDVEF
jgi:23S rRNA pseudouridine1911/1915/1917 synthase